MKKRAFTLIELLVVIAIIGILAGIVLVSLRGARAKAKDARIRSDIAQIRSFAEMIYDRDSQYNSLCKAGNVLNANPGGDADYGDEFATLDGDISTQNGGTSATCHASGDDYCIFAPLATAGRYYCIDSDGDTYEGTTNPGGVGYCDGTTFECP